jgi:dTDP-4-amino-4,6-dideoxygalactose transaminase
MSAKTERMFNRCRKDNITIIEDISHAYGSSYNGRRAGTGGHFVAGSFFGTKVLTCGEGGFVGTHSKVCYDFMKVMRNQGKNDDFEQIMEGYNYRVNEFTAAIAFARLKRLEKELALRGIIAEKYDMALREIDIRSVEKELGCMTGFYKYIVRTKHAHKLDERMENEGLSFTDWVHDKLLAQGNYPGAEEVADGHVCLQLIQDSTERDKYINTFKRLWKEINR